MKDSIEKNLEFKFVVFVSLLGAWIWLLKYYQSFIPMEASIKSSLAICVIILSFILFYPMLRLGVMLVYISMYQISDTKKREEEIEKEYKKHSKIFFEWWPIALLVTPAFILVALFGKPSIITYAIVFCSVIVIKVSFFKKIISIKETIKYVQRFYKPFFVYLLFFVAIIIASEILKKL